MLPNPPHFPLIWVLFAKERFTTLLTYSQFHQFHLVYLLCMRARTNETDVERTPAKDDSL